MVEEQVAKEKGWGKENYPYPTGVAYIECDEMKCVGCGMCQAACAMYHFGVFNKNLSRIYVRKYLLPLPKAVQMTCVQCQENERECQKACPVTPAAIYFDKKTLHMVVNKDTCLGMKCLLCQKACSADAVRVYPSVLPVPFVCDLCDPKNTGSRNPQCINVCPYTALRYSSSGVYRFGYSVTDLMRKHPDEKAELISKRLYPLPKTSMWRPEGGK